MAEERTQPASKRRRQIAREQGHVAHSPELTAAAGWLVALLLMGVWGEDLARGLVDLTSGSLRGAPVVWIDTPALVQHVRGAFLEVAIPLGVILSGFAGGALAAHQMQVRGLWAASQLAPDAGRLWTPGRTGGLAGGLERLVWSVVKAVLLAGVAVWSIRQEWKALEGTSALELPALTTAVGRALYRSTLLLGVVLLVLGVADYALRYLRFEALLRTTPEEQREDQRIMEGDQVLRGQRRRLVRAWRGDAPELLTGSSLILTGSDGLTLVLAGGPPPRRVTVRTVVQRSAGVRVRRLGDAAGMPRVDAPDLARRLASRATLNSQSTAPLPPELLRDLAAIWPTRVTSP
jgi:flagellar biosynthetic protein FlhB